ncbi:MAG: FecR domain-containing protein [Bacteroidota bacterium]
MKYDTYKVDDFLEDDFFISWVLHPTADKDIYWQNWLAEYPEQEATVSQAKALITGLKYKHIFHPKNDEVLDSYENILRQSKKSSRHNKVKNITLLIKVLAACLVIGIGISWYSFQNISVEPTQQVVQEEIITKKTLKGQKLNLFLGDGTEITLNAESTIRFPKIFDDEKREVYLEGEAFFDVQHDKNRPFIITSDKLQTTVLGTSFNVRSYKDENDISVAVLSGKVKVEAVDEQAKVIANNILTPNEILRFSKNDYGLIKRNVDIQKILAWKNKTILFEKASFEEIMKKLSRWYGVEFIVEEPLDIKGRFTGKFKNKSLEIVLNGLGFSSNIRYNIEGNEVHIFNTKTK